MYVSACLSSVRKLGEPLEEESSSFVAYKLTITIKGPFIFYVAYGAAKLQPNINISVLIFPLLAYESCFWVFISLDGFGNFNRLGGLGCFSGLDSLSCTCISELQGCLRCNSEPIAQWLAFVR